MDRTIACCLLVSSHKKDTAFFYHHLKFAYFNEFLIPFWKDGCISPMGAAESLVLDLFK